MPMSRTFGFGFVMAALVALAGCGGPLKYNVQSSRLAPGADAEIVATINEAQNQTALEIHAHNLPPPGRVNPDARHYIAWQRKNDDATWARLGSVKFDDEKRTAELTATVPEISFDLEISAEADENAASPSADVVFVQRVQD